MKAHPKMRTNANASHLPYLHAAPLECRPIQEVCLTALDGIKGITWYQTASDLTTEAGTIIVNG